MALRFQFRLRALLVFVSITGVGSAIIARLYDRDRCERRAVRAAEALGGSAKWEERKRVHWLPGTRRCTVLGFWDCDLACKDLSFLDELPELRHLYMSGCSVTDAQMSAISRVTTLEYLNVGGSQVTDAGLGSGSF